MSKKKNIKVRDRYEVTATGWTLKADDSWCIEKTDVGTFEIIKIRRVINETGERIASSFSIRKTLREAMIALPVFVKIEAKNDRPYKSYGKYYRQELEFKTD